jgi:hypothetical protein
VAVALERYTFCAYLRGRRCFWIELAQSLLWPDHEKEISDCEVKTMEKMLFRFGARFLVFAMVLTMAIPATQAQEAANELVLPVVYQAAGPNIESIQGTVDAYRLAVGDPNNASNPGPLAAGRREINWDGGGSDATTDPVTPFNVFLNSRGAQFTTPGDGLSQAPTSGGAQGGLAVLFNNATYETIFKPFSPIRLFTPVGSRITEGLFFVPGSNGTAAAVVTAFGAIFTDVDKPNGIGKGKEHSTVIEYYDAGGNLIYTGLVPSSAGDGSVSFFGIIFQDARIASVKIKTGDSRPGRDDDKKDIVMMDDFIYGEPQPLH